MQKTHWTAGKAPFSGLFPDGTKKKPQTPEKKRTLTAKEKRKQQTKKTPPKKTTNPKKEKKKTGGTLQPKAERGRGERSHRGRTLATGSGSRRRGGDYQGRRQVLYGDPGGRLPVTRSGDRYRANTVTATCDVTILQGSHGHDARRNTWDVRVSIGLAGADGERAERTKTSSSVSATSQAVTRTASISISLLGNTGKSARKRQVGTLPTMRWTKPFAVLQFPLVIKITPMGRKLGGLENPAV